MLNSVLFSLRQIHKKMCYTIKGVAPLHYVCYGLTAQFTKPLVGILPSWNEPPGAIPATGSIRGLWEFQELYQLKSWDDREL